MPLEVDEVVDIPGLTGEEIIVDLCEQIKNKLRRDCNLRPADSYINGYSAEISVKIQCYGIDTAQVETTISATKEPPSEAGTKPVLEVTEQVIIAHEPDLEAVRDRSALEAPQLEKNDTPAPSAPEGEKAQEPSRRQYGQRTHRVAGGGAGSFDK